MRCLRVSVAAAGLLLATAARAGNPYLPVAGEARFQSALQGAKPGIVEVRPFSMQRHPVTNGEFADFVAAHPEWRRGSVAGVFADAGYLSQWPSPAEPATATADRPVTRVSWFAAEAYCEAQDGRLPTWYEWELAAAADAQRTDARADPAWRQAILDWYARPAGNQPGPVEQSPANVYGLRDLHGLVWEWVQDANSLMGADEAARFCGSGALDLQQKENFAVLMRVATLSSVHPAGTLHSLGFRCVRPLP